VKLINPITLGAIADAVLADGLATPEEVRRLVGEMLDFARDPRTVVSVARVIQAWGYRDGSPMTAAPAAGHDPR
jgi:hypothetical protein